MINDSSFVGQIKLLNNHIKYLNTNSYDGHTYYYIDIKHGDHFIMDIKNPNKITLFHKECSKHCKMQCPTIDENKIKVIKSIINYQIEIDQKKKQKLKLANKNMLSQKNQIVQYKKLVNKNRNILRQKNYIGRNENLVYKKHLLRSIIQHHQFILNYKQKVSKKEGAAPKLGFFFFNSNSLTTSFFQSELASNTDLEPNHKKLLR